MFDAHLNHVVGHPPGDAFIDKPQAGIQDLAAERGTHLQPSFDISSTRF